ncbi:hypothetical protein BMG05_17765 [Mycobacterium malmoense]|nr:hypothetical protein BMG05_17765 [Mycobacterium malmoense]
MQSGCPGVKFVDEIALAWDLLDALPSLTDSNRVSLCVEIGAGEMPSAIEHLLTAFVVSRSALPADLAPRVSVWLDSYIGSTNEASLRRLLHRATEPDESRM